MATLITNKLKDFNTSQMEVEIAALVGFPEFTAQFAGFEKLDRFARVTPFPEATRDIGRSEIEGVVTVDTAARGDVRIETRNPLTGVQQTQLDGALNAHVDTVDTPEQTRAKQAVIDQASLLSAFNAGIADTDLRLTAKLLLRELGEDV